MKTKSKKTRDTAWNTQQHVYIEGIEFRKCSKCKELKTLDKYILIPTKKGSKPDIYCRNCKNKYKRENHGYIRKDPKLVSATRKRQGKEAKERFKTPEMLDFYRKLHAKAVLCITYKGLIIKEYDSAKAAGIDGFKPTGISVACNTGNLYKGFYWKFKKDV